MRHLTLGADDHMLRTYKDYLPPDIASSSADMALTFEHCRNMQRCWDRWSSECPDGRLAEPYEWLRCSDSCPSFDYCDDPYEEKE